MEVRMMSDSWAAVDLHRKRSKDIKQGKPAPPPEVHQMPTPRLRDLALDRWYSYENPREDSKEDEFWSWLMTKGGGRTDWEAAERGNASKMKAIAGRQGDEPVDAGNFEWVQFVRDIYKPNDRHHHLYMAITSPPPPEITGVGKSFTGYSIIETLDMISDFKFATNNSTDDFTTTKSWGELLYWLKNTDGQKLFFWDEAAQVLMYDDQVSGKELAKLIRLLRKHNCHLLLVGHTGRGITKDVRRMLMFLQKQSQTEAKYGRGLRESAGEYMELAEVEETVENIPPTSIEYNSIEDKGSFDFDDDVERPPEDYEKESCKVCDRTVAITDGFCHEHDETDLSDVDNQLRELNNKTLEYDEIRAHYKEIYELPDLDFVLTNQNNWAKAENMPELFDWLFA
jgi:hypothetical protein